MTASAQRRVVRVQRPVVVVDPYYYNYYGYKRYRSLWYVSFYDSYFYDPYLSERRQNCYLEKDLQGNQRELKKHLESYYAYGVITAK